MPTIDDLLENDPVAYVKANRSFFSGPLTKSPIPPVRTVNDLKRLSSTQLRRWVASN